MRFLIDANLPRSVVGVLTRLGHESLFARDIGLADAPDRVVAERARSTQAALLTRDLDFADVRNYPPGQYNGIVVFRLADDVVAKEIARIAELFLSEPSFLRQLNGRLAIVEPTECGFVRHFEPDIGLSTRTDKPSRCCCPDRSPA